MSAVAKQRESCGVLFWILSVCGWQGVSWGGGLILSKDQKTKFRSNQIGCGCRRFPEPQAIDLDSNNASRAAAEKASRSETVTDYMKMIVPQGRSRSSTIKRTYFPHWPMWTSFAI